MYSRFFFVLDLERIREYIYFLGGIRLQKKKINILFLFLLLTVLVAGCEEKKGRITDGSDVYVKPREDDITEEPEEDSEEVTQELDTLYAVTGIDTEHGILTLRNCETTREKPFNYTGGTYIKDKYGDNLTIDQISLGELVNIERRGENLTMVQISKDVFSYDDLHKFSLDKEEKSLSVGDSSYFFDPELLIFYNGSRISLSEVSEQDTICLKGMGQQIYVIQVTKGHGTVVLENTDIFQGGYITIGNVVSKKITPQMRIEIPEGSYLLAVAKIGRAHV